MKLMHIADLHLGKKLIEKNLFEDQSFILNQILDIIHEQNVNTLLIAGDVYDKSAPNTDAVELFDNFLTELSKMKISVCVISGNHDSPERLGFCREILDYQDIHLSGKYNGLVSKIELKDEFGPISIYLLPYLKPDIVKEYYPELKTNSFNDAVKTVVDSIEINLKERNILLLHQFITSSGVEAERCESDLCSVGGLDNVDCEPLRKFDYVALGHLHGPQSAGEKYIRYCGSPLKYSFSECRQKKSVTLINLNEKGNLEIIQIPLSPMHDLREIKGPILKLMSDEVVKSADNMDYIHAVITDEELIYDPQRRLLSKYPNLLKLTVENRRTSNSEIIIKTDRDDFKKKSYLDLFSDFYLMQQNTQISDDEIKIVKKIFEELTEVSE